MDDFYESRGSIYCYKGTNVLINKLNIRDFGTLMKLENRIAVYKAFELRRIGITGNFDQEHLKNIHKFMFEDLYDFAGEFRTENIAKDEFRFAEWEYIESELDRLLSEIKSKNYFEGYSKEMLAENLSYYLAELNVLHPFREGNGRAIREFIRQLALKNGYLLDMREVSSEEMLYASKKSVYDTHDLEKLIYRSLKKEI